ncbi:MAG: type II secretion system F family protein [Stellaceae bacterium]
MPQFHYRALRPSGTEIAGELVADSERDAVSRLQAIGAFPIEITPPAARRRRRLITLTAGGRRRLPARDLVLFTRQLAALVGAGVGLDRALGLVAGGAGRAAPLRLATELLAAVNRGESLSRAAAEHRALPRHFAMVIGAGEARGDIAGALDRLAGVLERGRETARALIGALVYPLSVAVVACLSVSFLLGFVVPRFDTLLTGFRHEPPLAMRLLLACSMAFRESALPLALVAALLGLFAVWRWRDPGFRVALSRGALRMPLVGPLLAKIEAERVAFLLGNLMAAGVDLPSAMAATRAAVGNEAVRAGLATAEAGIERGDSVTASLAAGGLLPDLAGELVRVGEETGDLAAMLIKAGDLLRREIEATTGELIALVTPVSIVLLGLIIGAIAFALLGTVMEVYDLAS